MSGVFIQAVAALCALGNSIADIEQQLFSISHSPLKPTDAFTPEQTIPVGMVADLQQLADTRNNSLLRQALAGIEDTVANCVARFGAKRVGVVLGSSTSGIAEGEAAIGAWLTTGQFPASFRYQQQEMYAPAQFVAEQLGVTGPAWTISTACTSGAKAIASGARLLAMGLCDAVVVGGADSLCKLTLRGFSSLEAVSKKVCNPFSANRNGINIGEAAALMVLTREPSPVRLASAGETSDAHHISAPHPEGVGALKAMSQALAKAGLKPEDIDYINTHGTATEHNDRMEALALSSLFPPEVACGSTKPLTGHTLGAAGALEAVFCWLTLLREDGMLPRHLWDGQACDEAKPLINLGANQITHPVRRALSNSFAFGGNNIALVFERYSG